MLRLEGACARAAPATPPRAAADLPRSPAQTQRRMQMLADEKRTAARKAAVQKKRSLKTPEVKAAGKKFKAEMEKDSAYDGELFTDFNAWLTRNERE